MVGFGFALKKKFERSSALYVFATPFVTVLGDIRMAFELK